MMTFAEHAEAWMHETGRPVPAWGTEAWSVAYREWADYAFRDLHTLTEALSEEVRA